MSTGNFHNVNAGKIFAFIPERDDNEEDNYVDDSFEYECFIDNVKEELEKLNEKKDQWFNKDTGKDYNELRSFPSTVLGTLIKSKTYKLSRFGNVEMRIFILIVLRSGYYEGCNLDWSVEYECEGDEFQNIDDTTGRLEWLCDDTEIAKNKAPVIEKWLESETENLID